MEMFTEINKPAFTQVFLGFLYNKIILKSNKNFHEFEKILSSEKILTIFKLLHSPWEIVKQKNTKSYDLLISQNAKIRIKLLMFQRQQWY